MAIAIAVTVSGTVTTPPTVTLDNGTVVVGVVDPTTPTRYSLTFPDGTPTPLGATMTWGANSARFLFGLYQAVALPPGSYETSILTTVVPTLPSVLSYAAPWPPTVSL